jgi:DNA-binding NarL/FixJ family response regulator
MVQQPIFRQGIIALLSTMATCEIIGQPTSASEALELARKCEPEVAVLDTFFKTIDMFELAQQMRTYSPRTAVIILSELEGEEWLFQAIKVGAAAYSTRNITAAKLIETVRRVSQGEYLMNDDVLSQPKLARRVFQSFSEMATRADEDLHSLNRVHSPVAKQKSWPTSRRAIVTNRLPNFSISVTRRSKTTSPRS